MKGKEKGEERNGCRKHYNFPESEAIFIDMRISNSINLFKTLQKRPGEISQIKMFKPNL